MFDAVTDGARAGHILVPAGISRAEGEEPGGKKEDREMGNVALAGLCNAPAGAGLYKPAVGRAGCAAGCEGSAGSVLEVMLPRVCSGR